MKLLLLTTILVTGFMASSAPARETPRKVQAVDPAEFTFTVQVNIVDMSPELKQAKVSCGVGRHNKTMGSLTGVTGLGYASSKPAAIGAGGALKTVFKVSLQVDSESQMQYMQDKVLHNYHCKLLVSEDGSGWKPLIVKPDDYSRNNYVKNGTLPNIPHTKAMPHVARIGHIPN